MSTVCLPMSQSRDGVTKFYIHVFLVYNHHCSQKTQSKRLLRESGESIKVIPTRAVRLRKSGLS